MSATPFADLNALAAHLRQQLQNVEEPKKFILLYAYNGTGKTRLSMAFKDLGKKGDERDTLYFNAYTEDLFHWDNDLDGDRERCLQLNSESSFFAGLKELEMDNRIRPFLQRYTDFDFVIDYDKWLIRFSRKVNGVTVDNIKVSRGEENLFIWCFFLAIVQLALDGADAYKWVKYIYIDDPISSLDENNAIAVGHDLAQLLARKDHAIKTVFSSHHSLFFNVLWNELREIDRKKFSPYFLSCSQKTGEFNLIYTGDTPFFHHLALLIEICAARNANELHTHHFNALRGLLEKSSCFHGHKKFSVCIKKTAEDPDETLFGRILNILSHGNYSFYEPAEMLPETKETFEKVLDDFLGFYPFNRELLPSAPATAPAPAAAPTPTQTPAPIS
jgi:wobble nucleotide-excising tRNase